MIARNLRIPLAAAIATALFHLLANPHYGFFRDELYFIICGRHPDWGYVDQPPLVPLIAAGSQVLGASLFALRATAALCGAASVFCIARLVQALGGGRFAQIFAAIVAALTPVLTAFAGKVGPDMLQLWMWPLAALYLQRLIEGEDERNWLGVGIALGIAAESKYSVAFFAIAAFAGIAVTGARTIFRSPWFLAGIAVAIVLALPNFLWQASHAFPMWELLRNGQNGKNVILSPGMYLIQQLFMINPLYAPVYLIALVGAFSLPRARWIGWTWIFLMALMIVMHGKNYYPGSVYAVLIAPGAVLIERWTQGRTYARVVAGVAVALAGLWAIPLVEPVLPEESFMQYQAMMASVIHVDLATEKHRRAAMNPDWADMHGWRELAAAVARVYDRLPPADRTQAVAFAQNYGEASAIAFFAPSVPVISGHNQYWLWGYGGATGRVIIDVGGDCGASAHLFERAERVGTVSSPYVMPYEDNLSLSVCRGLKKPLADLWPTLKSFE